MAIRQPTELITIRCPRTVAQEVRRIAEREGDSQSVVFRRLLRVGLDVERRGTPEQVNQ